MDDINDLNLEQMNWELCIAYLDDAIEYLHECIEHLESAAKNVRELNV